VTYERLAALHITGYMLYNVYTVRHCILVVLACMRRPVPIACDIHYLPRSTAALFRTSHACRILALASDFKNDMFFRKNRILWCHASFQECY
jgi:hypothetical protein